MKNDFSNISAENEFTGSMTIEPQESFDDEQQEQGWPGDGSGTDDLADYNQNEADDYSNE